MCAAEEKWKRSVATRKTQAKADMRSARRAFDRAVQSAKRRFWRNQQDELLQLADGDPRHFWEHVKRLGQCGGSRSQPIPWEVVDGAGQSVTDRTAVLQRWQSDFTSLMNPVNDEREESPQLPATLRNQNTVNTGMNSPITIIDIYSALSHSKNGKAIGVDGIPVEVLRNRFAIQFMLYIFNECFRRGTIPSSWSKSIINPIPKTGDKRDPLNYRGIALTSAMYTIVCYILKERLVKLADNK